MYTYLSSPACWVLFLGSLAMTGTLTPVVMRLAWRVGAVDRGGYRKVNQAPVPLLGGLALAIPFFVVCVAAIVGPAAMFQTIADYKLRLAVLVLASALIVGLGVVDDLRGASARTKFVIQISAALFVCAVTGPLPSVEIPFFEQPVVLHPLFGMLVIVLWIVGITNAFNLVDGVDGLAAGVALIASLGLAVIAAINGANFIVLLCLALAGSLLAFLAYNSHPAKVFLGDTGSMFLGFVLATISVMGCHKSQAAVIFLAPILALGVPIFETLTSIVRRYLRGRPIFVGDQGHTHHRLLKKGFSQRKVAAMLYVAALFCMVSAVLYQLLVQKARAIWIPIGLYVVTVLVMAWVGGYLKVVGGRLAARYRQRNLLLGALARYGALAMNTGASALTLSEILRIARRELKLRFLEVWLEDGLLLIASSGRMSLNGHSDSKSHSEDGPPLIAPNGFALNGETSTSPANSFGEIRVESANGYDLVVRYQYHSQPDEDECQDLTACLASLFTQSKIAPPVLPLASRSTQQQLEAIG